MKPILINFFNTFIRVFYKKVIKSIVVIIYKIYLNSSRVALGVPYFLSVVTS